MKILWLRPSTGENISVRRERIAESLRDYGHEIDIRDASGIDAIGAIKQAVAGEYDVIVGNVRVGLYLGFPLTRLLRTPFLGDVSDPITDIDYLPEPLFRFFQWYEWQVLKRADATVFVYESTYREATNRGISNPIKLPNAVNYDLFADPDQNAVNEARSILQAEGVNLEKPIAIYIGIFSPRYCTEEMLATAEHAPEWEFVFVGEGGLEEAVQQTAQEVENVYYPGSFPYRLMPGFLSLSNVGFCFKDAEQPLKLKEYGAAGLPTIVRYGELSEWYEEDELVFVEPTPNAISNALNWLAEDLKARKSYGQNLQEIAKKYSWEMIATEYHRLFTEIAESQ